MGFFLSKVPFFEFFEQLFFKTTVTSCFWLPVTYHIETRPFNRPEQINELVST